MNDRQITVPLVARTGLHVGAGYGDSVTDAFVLSDSRGHPVIPGSSLAGALRALATRLAPRLGHKVCLALQPPPDHDDTEEVERRKRPCGCAVCKLFGDVNPSHETGQRRDKSSEKAAAGRLWVYDADLVGPPPAWIRDGVGIGRASGAAYRQGLVKFDLEVLPAGTEFELRLELQAPDAETDVDGEEGLLAAVLAEWAEGRGAVGGRASCGLGAFELPKQVPVIYRRLDLRDSQQLFTYLSLDDPWPQATTDPGWLHRRLGEVTTVPILADHPESVARSWVRLTATIQALGPLLVNDPVAAATSGFDHAPLQINGDREMPILPGSSLKGALRSQAERIARTLATGWAYEKDAGSSPKEAFYAHCPACDPLAGGAGEPLASCDALLTGAHLPKARPIVSSTDEVSDKHLCMACRLFGSPRRGSRLRVEDAALVGQPRYKPLDMLAIDRFTGGGADQFKFDAAALWKPRFTTSLFLENPEPWELGWLFLTLRDLQDGLVRVGFGAAKGFGQVRAETWDVKFGYLSDKDALALGLPASGESEGGSVYQKLSFSQDSAGMWQAVAQRWVEAFAAEVRQVQRDASEAPERLPALQADNYFGTEIERLYPAKEVHNG